ncbi:MAG TPA: ComEC/Rec2 family competence protein [Baekduia sp.]|uniref:ComEC/Rec2 family competence protein n=1 Tax=Baekduia sp. TaxID=2600305 RepID=UPI002D78940C|nr:ComEC/Rec2 family competence protein [Baekduia sp.]HET6509185.1 ComEC/Rec2 family competence protein [Baekduia sp.]
MSAPPPRRRLPPRTAATAAALRARAADSARAALHAAHGHPRHVVLALAVAGLLLGPRVPASVVAAGALAVAAAVAALPLVRRPVAALGLAVTLLAAAWAGGARTAALDATRLPIGDQVHERATVLAPPRSDAFGGHRFAARLRGEPVLVRVPAWLRDAPPPRVGDVVALDGTLREPDRGARAVHAHATLRATALRATGRRRGGALGVVDGVRRRAERALAGHLPPNEAALLRGMVLGDDSELPDDVADAFTAVGLSHLMAASGQNVALLAALVLALSIAVGAGVRARWPATSALIALYVPLAGGGASIQRAGLMGAATIAAALAGRPASRWHALLLAAVATLALDPRASGDAGWQLSFAAVVGIAVLAVPIRRRLPRRLPAAAAEAVAVTLAATLATAPLVALHFGRLAPITVPANVLAAPAVAPIMWLGFAAAALGQLTPALAAPLVALTGPPLGYLVGVARTSANLPDPPLVALAALAVAALAARRRRTRPAAALALALAVAALAVHRHATALAPPPPPGTLRVTALDVGQGDATLLQADGHAVLVDAGPPGTTLVAQLRTAGVRHLDALVLTHPQLDHDGDAPAVLRAFPTDLLLDGRDGDRSPTSRAIDAPAHATRIVPAQQGQALHAGPLTLSVLWPPARDPAAAAADATDPNDRAIVALATAFNTSILLTADAESPILQPLDLPPVDVLKVSHHGSADPGLPQLLQQLQPHLALIEVGAHNTYGHPAPSTLAALHAAAIPTKRTDRDGTIRIDLTGPPAPATPPR